MKFINVSNENMAVIKKWIDPDAHYKETSPGIYYDSWDGMTVDLTEENSFTVTGGCCYEDGPGTHVMWMSEYLILSEDDDEKFSDWLCDIDNNNYDRNLTWDFALNVGTEY